MLYSFSIIGASGDFRTLTDIVSPVLHVGEYSLITSTIYSISLKVSPDCQTMFDAVKEGTDMAV